MIQWIIIVVLLAFIISRLLPVKGVTTITSAEAKQLMKEHQNMQYVDVRTENEYNGNHDRAFTNIPLHVIGNEVNRLKKEEPIMLICQSGMRSMRAAKMLKKAGFTKIYNVRGGMAAWV